MLQPSLGGLGFALILVIILLGFWIWDIYKHRRNALLLIGTVALLSTLVFYVGDHWFIANADSLILWLIVINLAVAILTPRVLGLLGPRPLVVSLVIVLVLLSWFQLSLRNNLKLYLTMRLSSELPSIDLFYWADRADIQTDWTDIYKTWPENELLLRESVMTYLVYANDNLTRVYRNKSYRDATFEAWAVYNARYSSRRIDFFGSSYYEDCAKNSEFMNWWVELAIADNRHLPGLTWFLGILTDHMNYFTGDDLAQVEQTLKSCHAISKDDDTLTLLLGAALAVIENNRGKDMVEERVDQ